jgi:hypothetical protein
MVATKTMKGRWPGDRAVSRGYEELRAWTRAAGAKTGKWFFRSLSGMDDRAGVWELGIEVRTRKPLRGGGGVVLKTFPASAVVSIKFDPSRLSPMVAYASLEGWMRWTGRQKKMKWNGPWREVYSGNPWKSKSAWAHTEIQAPIKK